MFGKNFVYATLCSLFFNAFGIIGGLLSPAIGRRLGLRCSSMVGFAVVFLILLTLGLSSDNMPLWASLLVPALFVLCHSGGPGMNGGSLSSLSFRSELRAGANSVAGTLGTIGAALGLSIFPVFHDLYGLQTTFLIISAIPLLASIVCFTIPQDPIRTTIQPDNEPGAPQFESPHSSYPESMAPKSNRSTKRLDMEMSF